MNKLIKEFLRWRGKGWFEIRNFFGILEVFDINKFEENNVEYGSLLGMFFSY